MEFIFLGFWHNPFIITVGLSMAGCWQNFWDGRVESGLHNTLIISPQRLFLFRGVAVILCIISYVNSLVDEKSFFRPFAYATFWGFFTGFIFFIIATIDYLSHRQTGHVPSRCDSTLGLIAHILFEIAFSIELLIVVVFWVFLYPGFAKGNPSFWAQIHNFFVHGGVLILLWLDNCFNMIRFHYHHLSIVIVYLLSYGYVNIIVTVTSEPVYPILKWDSWFDGILGAGFFALTTLHFLIGYYFFKWKKTKYDQMKLQHLSPEARALDP